MFTAKVKLNGVLVCQSTEWGNKKDAANEALRILELTNLPMNYEDPLVVEIYYRDAR